MTVCGFTFVRNAVRLDYPFLESLRSLLPLCDRVVVAVGRSEDETLSNILALRDPRIEIIETVWDESLRSGGAVLAQQTDLALAKASGDWGIYLQADEVLHESEYPAIRKALASAHDDARADGLLFGYHHFYGSYEYLGVGRRWYRNEVRAVRLGIGVQSWGDAQGFRRNGEKLRVRASAAHIYHYGWVKPPAIQQLKQQSFNKLWHDDSWMKEHIPPVVEYEYARGGRLVPFQGMHPSVMQERVQRQSWKFTYDEGNVRRSLRERLLDGVERSTGWRVGEYKNYTLL